MTVIGMGAMARCKGFSDSITAGSGTSTGSVAKLETRLWLGRRRLIEVVELLVGVVGGLVGGDVAGGNGLTAQLDGLGVVSFDSGLDNPEFAAKGTVKVGTAFRVSLVVAQALGIASVDVEGEDLVLPDVHVGELRVVGLDEVGVDDADGEGDDIFTRAARGGLVPVDGARVVAVLRVARGIRDVEGEDEHVGVEQRVAEQHVVLTSGCDVVGDARVAMFRIRESDVEAPEKNGPWEPHGEGMLELEEKVTAVLIPGVSLDLGAGAAEIRGEKHGLAITEGAACLVGITVGTRVRVPVGPLGPVLVGVKGATAPAVESEVNAGVEEATDGGVVLRGLDLWRQLLRRGEREAFGLTGGGRDGNGIIFLSGEVREHERVIMRMGHLIVATSGCQPGI